MKEMIPILYQWPLANYTSVKSFIFWKVSVKLCNFKVPVYKGVPLPQGAEIDNSTKLTKSKYSSKAPLCFPPMDEMKHVL